MTDAEKDTLLFKEAKEVTQKYIYFMLTITIACIGYSISEPMPEEISICFFIKIFSILCWGVSFYFGIWYIFRNMQALQNNRQLFQNISPEDKQLSRQTHDFLNARAVRNFKWVRWALITGVISYLIYYITLIPFDTL